MTAIITRLPTAARRRVRQPNPLACIALRREAGIPSLPSAADRAQRSQDEILERSKLHPETLLAVTILRALPGWQARNVVRLLKQEFHDEPCDETAQAYCIGLSAALRTVTNDGER